MNSQFNVDFYYDLEKENFILSILSGYTIYKGSAILFYLNVLILVLMFAVYIYLLVMCIITFTVVSQAKEYLEVIHTVLLIVVIIGSPLSRHLSHESVLQVRELLLAGVYEYKSGFSELQLNLKDASKKQIMKLISFIKKFYLGIAAFNSFGKPLLNRLLLKDSKHQVINPYLPLPIYSNFGTDTYLGFVAVFTLHTIVHFGFVFTATIGLGMFMEFFTQIILQLDILNDSISNIDKRALALVKRTQMKKKVAPDFCQSSDLQKCLLFCLRENVEHHQTIKRLKSLAAPYLESIHFLAVLVFSVLIASCLFTLIEDPGSNYQHGVMLLLYLFAYYIMSSVGQNVINKSKMTCDLLYSTPWTSCSQKFKVMLHVIMVNAQNLIVIRTKGFSLAVSIETFADMISLGYKIMNLFR